METLHTGTLHSCAGCPISGHEHVGCPMTEIKKDEAPPPVTQDVMEKIEVVFLSSQPAILEVVKV